jgi:hypothetical protein
MFLWEKSCKSMTMSTLTDSRSEFVRGFSFADREDPSCAEGKLSQLPYVLLFSTAFSRGAPPTVERSIQDRPEAVTLPHSYPLYFTGSSNIE